jgi:hypothetical protein
MNFISSVHLLIFFLYMSNSAIFRKCWTKRRSGISILFTRFQVSLISVKSRNQIFTFVLIVKGKCIRINCRNFWHCNSILIESIASFSIVIVTSKWFLKIFPKVWAIIFIYAKTIPLFTHILVSINSINPKLFFA